MGSAQLRGKQYGARKRLLVPSCHTWYTAGAMPMLYNIQAESHVDDNHGLDAVLRNLMPASFGLRKHPDKREETICTIMNTSFILYSSIVSFYVPIIMTLLVYVQIYAMLRWRRKRMAAKRISVAMEHETQPPIKAERFQNKCTHPEDVKLCTLMVQSNGSTSVSKKKLTLVREAIPYSEESEKARFVGPPERSRPIGTPLPFQLGTTSRSCLMAAKWKAPSPIEVSADPECDGRARFFRRSAFVVWMVSDEKQVPVAKSAAKANCPTRGRRKQQMLVVVLGVFIICWLPLFITHILNVHCQRCYTPPALYSACAWLGYVINPIIYTTFNVAFRKAFMKTLHC
ncbi:D(2) dopamine receptor A-like [Cetorhinus maximus]